jgi:hypothetical protein
LSHPNSSSHTGHPENDGHNSGSHREHGHILAQPHHL